MEIPPRIVTRQRKCLGAEFSMSALGSQAQFPLLKPVCGKPKGLFQVLKVGGSGSPPSLSARGEGGRGSSEPDKTAPESVPPLFPSTVRQMAQSRGERTENIFPGLLVFVSGTISTSRLEKEVAFFCVCAPPSGQDLTTLRQCGLPRPLVHSEVPAWLSHLCQLLGRLPFSREGRN